MKKQQLQSWTNHYLSSKPKELWFINDRVHDLEAEVSKLEKRKAYWLQISRLKEGEKPTYITYDVELIKQIEISKVIDRTPVKQSIDKDWYLCPFHNEKTPSFVWNKTKGFYHCFGCGESGDIIKFYTKLNNCSFQDACRYLQHYV